MASALASARACRERALASRPSVEQQSAQVDALLERAKEHGLVAKTAGQSGQAGVLQRKWQRWLEGDGCFVADRIAAGGTPDLEDMKRFSTWVYSAAGRERFSCAGRKGCGDAYGDLQIPYMLGKFVFPRLGYNGWAGLSVAEAQTKNAPLATELRGHWKALKTHRNVMQREMGGRFSRKSGMTQSTSWRRIN